jgi:3-hydroxymyristoyl/3-hydroxydecanoyl-(acyl carrier protein) dehydratase
MSGSAGSPVRRAWLQVPGTHPMFAGHFPGRPVVPGAWLLAQALQALQVAWPGEADVDRIDTAKFHRLVAPGTRLELTFSPSASGAIEMSIADGDELVAAARLRRAAPAA